jgi:hypothetical protein
MYFGLSVAGFWGWCKDWLRLPALRMPVQPDGWNWESMANVPWFRTATEVDQAHKQGLISRHEARMFKHEVGEGFVWWLLDRSVKTYVCVLSLVAIVVYVLHVL